MSISQSSVAKGLLDKFGMFDANPVPVPSPAGFVFTKADYPEGDEKAQLEQGGKGATEFRAVPLKIFCRVGRALT